MSKEVGEEERDAQGVDRSLRSNNATSADVEIDPHRRRLGRSQTDFALQAIVECGESEMNRSVVALVCMFITVGPMKKPLARQEREKGGHVLKDTTSRGLCV